MSLGEDAAALARIAREGLDVAVPSCPGWCMADLVWHTGTTIHWGEAVSRLRANGIPDAVVTVEAPADDGLIDWLEAGAGRLLLTLAEVDPDDELGRDWIESGFPGPSLARHYAREVGIHRWDAERVYGEPGPIADDLASDWLDGVLMTWLPRASAQGRQAQGGWSGERLQLRRRNGPERWHVTLRAPGAVDVSRDERAADVTLEGRAAELLLLVLNRISAAHEGIRINGSAEILDRWRAEVRYGRPASGAHRLGSPRPTGSRLHR